VQSYESSLYSQQAWWFNKAEPALSGHNVATAQVEKRWSKNPLLIFLDRKTFDDHVYKRVITRKETLKPEKVERDAYTGEWVWCDDEMDMISK